MLENKVNLLLEPFIANSCTNKQKTILRESLNSFILILDYIAKLLTSMSHF